MPPRKKELLTNWFYKILFLKFKQYCINVNKTILIPVSRDPVDQPRTAQQRKNTGKEPVKGSKRFPIPMIAVHPKRRKKWY